MALLKAILLFVAVATLGALLFKATGQPAPPGQATACAGGVTILLAGKPLSAGCVLNILPGNGIIATPSADPAIGGTDLSFSYNSALIPTLDTEHANPNYCKSTNGTPAYTCKLPVKQLVEYTEGQAFLLNVDQACSAGCTLAVDLLPSRTIKNSDGVTDPNGALIPGRAQWVWFDGTIFRMVN